MHKSSRINEYFLRKHTKACDNKRHEVLTEQFFTIVFTELFTLSLASGPGAGYFEYYDEHADLSNGIFII